MFHYFVIRNTLLYYVLNYLENNFDLSVFSGHTIKLYCGQILNCRLKILYSQTLKPVVHPIRTMTYLFESPFKSIMIARRAS